MSAITRGYTIFGEKVMWLKIAEALQASNNLTFHGSVGSPGKALDVSRLAVRLYPWFCSWDKKGSIHYIFTRVALATS